MRDFEFSAAWQQLMYTRRESPGVPGFTPVKKPHPRVKAAVARCPRLAASTAPDLLQAAQAELADLGRSTPLGAAVVATAVISSGNDGYHNGYNNLPFVDLWIAEAGLSFAVEAAVEMLNLTCDRRQQPEADIEVRSLRPDELADPWRNDDALHVLLRVRSALAAAPLAEYDQIVAQLAVSRSRHAWRTLATALLVPGNHEWLESEIQQAVATDDVFRVFALTHAVSEPEQLRRLRETLSVDKHDNLLGASHESLVTFVDGLGAGALDSILTWLDKAGQTDYFGRSPVAREQRMAEAVTQIPTEAAVLALAERAQRPLVREALLGMERRWPDLVLRALAAGPLEEWLRSHVRSRRLTPKEVGLLPPASAARVQAILDELVPEATELPTVVARPPWENRGPAPTLVTLEGLRCDDAPSIGWHEGEREEWAALPRESDYIGEAEVSWAQHAERMTSGESPWWQTLYFLDQAPRQVVVPVLDTWTPEWHLSHRALAPMVARLELDVLPALMRHASANGFNAAASLLAPYASPEVAVLMAGALARLRTGRTVASAWLQRHPGPAARALVPPALGPAGAERRHAEQALMFLMANGHSDQVRAAASGYGQPALAAIEQLLTGDPLLLLPSRVPSVPTWVEPPLLPQLRLRDGSGAVPTWLADRVVTLFQLSRADHVYAGLEVLQEAVRPEDLSQFAWAVFERWRKAGADSKEKWVLDALVLVGEDEVVRRLTPVILAWPAEGGHARAVAGLGVLTAIGSDVSLLHLHTVSQRAKHKGLKKAAQQKLSEIARDRGLTPDELADRIVPTLGLDASGGLRLDYGPRQFVVGFDEQLKPFVTDTTGKRLTSLPRPGVRDDTELAPAAYERFAALKKDVRRIAADTVQRLEQAMTHGRRWSGADFRSLLVQHPLLGHLTRRLVWGLYDERGELVGTMRVAEDRSLADVEDESVVMADDVVVGVVHPLSLGSALTAAWAEVFTDYEILQPFPQLARSVYPTADEIKSFEGVSVSSTKLLALEHRGWQRDTPEFGGHQGGIGVRYPSGAAGRVWLDPGFVIGDPAGSPEQTLREAEVTGSDRVAVSEFLRDLHLVAGTLDHQ